MKKLISLLIFILAGTSVFGQTNPQHKNTSIQIDGYAARVNERVITRSEVRDALAPLLPELYRTYKDEQLEQELDKAFVKARNDLVERTLMMEAFKARGGQIPDQYVNEEINRIINDRFKGDKALFEQLLSNQKKTREEYKTTLREQMSVGMVFNEEVGRRARVTPQQVKTQYEASKELYFIPEKIEHSVILLNKGTTPEDQIVKKQEAESIHQQLIEGADFADLAKEVSEGSRAADGGKFPWMQPKDVRPEIQNTLKNLPAGEISEITETDSELYIIKVHARRQPGYKSFDEVRKDIKAALVAKEKARLKERWLTRLKKNNYIVIYE